jgi:hypothetical protein
VPLQDASLFDLVCGFRSCCVVDFLRSGNAREEGSGRSVTVGCFKEEHHNQSPTLTSCLHFFLSFFFPLSLSSTLFPLLLLFSLLNFLIFKKTNQRRTRVSISPLSFLPPFQPLAYLLPSKTDLYSLSSAPASPLFFLGLLVLFL